MLIDQAEQSLIALGISNPRLTARDTLAAAWSQAHDCGPAPKHDIPENAMAIRMTFKQLCLEVYSDPVAREFIQTHLPDDCRTIDDTHCHSA